MAPTGSYGWIEWMQLTGAAGRWSNVGVSLGVDQQGAQELTVAIDRMEE